MSETPNLREVQQRTARLLSYEDGIWDLQLGTVFMLLAFYEITRAWLGPGWNLVLFVGLMLAEIAILTFLRWRISIPRLGYIKPRFTPATKGILAVTIALVALTAGLVVLTLVSPRSLSLPGPEVPPTNLGSYGMELAVLGVLVVLFSAMGYLLGVPRLYLYGWMLGAANLVGVILYRGAPGGFNLPMGIAAGVILLIGAALLLRMLRKYPVQSVGV
jgi:hypothetical protein